LKSFRIPRGSIDAVFVRTALLATVAVILAYSIGKATNFIAADIAAIWALISVKATFHTAVRETVIQIAGTLLGGIVGFLAVQIYGFNIWLMAGLVLFSFAVGFLFKMGIDGSAIMGFTIIAVTSNSFSLESTEARISGVILGTLVATFFSLFVKRGTPQGRIRQELTRLIERKKQVLMKLSELVSAGSINEKAIFDLKVSSKILLEDFNSLVVASRELTRGAKWSPLTKKAEAEELAEEVASLRDDAIVVVDMVESVETLRTTLPKSFADRARKSIASAADVLFNNGTDTKTGAISLPEDTSIDPTPTQILLTNDLIAGAEKLKKRRKNKR
jgi:uncharacterized membrane protein YgaE (UPF0421/DUF939 family)